MCWNGTRDFKKWQCHKSLIWLGESGKIIMVAWEACFLVQIFFCALPNDNVRISYLTFWQHYEPAAVNLSFSAFTCKPFITSKWKYMLPIMYHVTNMEKHTKPKLDFNATFSLEQLLWLLPLPIREKASAFTKVPYCTCSPDNLFHVWLKLTGKWNLFLTQKGYWLQLLCIGL